MQIFEVSADRALRRIDMTPLQGRFTENLSLLMKILEFYGFKLRIVGGAVRDLLLGMSPRDIDLATDALPDAVMFILGKHNIPYVTKGIPHGTVKVKFSDDEEYEITSIAYTVEDECCPQTIKIHTSNSWKEDAERRDFTVDALSLSTEGHLYDYVDGLDDIRKQYVRFLGDAEARIKKDPILIMRFFKLLSMFREPKFDASVIPVLKANMKSIKKIKPERLTMEIGNVKRGQNGERVLKMMKNLGFDDALAQLKEEYAIFEAALLTLVPAIKVYLKGEEPKIFIGQRGQTHADVFEQIPENIGSLWARGDESILAGPPESGFWDVQDRQWLTRADALRLVKAGESRHLARLQKAAEPA